MPRPAFAILVLSLALAAVAPGGAQVAADADALLRTLTEQLAAGRYDEALDTARRCGEALPGHVGVWYNLAGLEEKGGDRAAGMAALRQAVLLGFDDFRFADQDADLGDLREDPGCRELRAAWAAGLAARVRDRRLDLEADRWSAPIELADRRGGLDPPAATARLRVTRSHLELEILAELRPVGMQPPWRGGTGLFVAVLMPEAPATGEGRLFAEFGVGMADGVPVGAVLLGSRWQSLSELTPKLQRDADSGRLRLTFAIPWAACDPLHPLVDDEIGLNLTWIRRGGDDGGQAAWLADPATGRADRSWRRGIPIHTRWGAEAGPATGGLVTERVVRDGTIDLAPLVALTGDATGPTVADIVIRDRDGTLHRQDAWTLTGDGPIRSRIGSLAAVLPPGSVRLGANVGETGWETNLVVLPAGWESDVAARIAGAPERERRGLRFRLDAVVEALANRYPRENPAAIGATADELERLLAAVETRGTSLPSGGSYLAVAPASGGAPEMLCSLALPDGWRRGDPVRAVLILARAPGQEQQAVMMAPRLVAERAAAGVAGPPLIVAVAHLDPIRDTEAARVGGRRLVDWLRDFVAVDAVHVAGVDLLAATALELAAARPAAVAGVLLITGMDFVPYPDVAPGALPPLWAELPADLPVGWIWFPDEQRPGDQAAVLQQVLRARGTTLDPARPVAGGLDFSQAWSRAVIWALE